MNPPDYLERRKIVEQLDTTMIVEAAAGTGKTTEMVNRMIALLEAGKCSIDQLAAVTFTRKAAAELRERFQREWDKLGGKHSEVCYIGTVHSFCGRLLRERPVEAGVDPDFQELDEVSDARLREKAWESFCNELFANDDLVLDELEKLGLTLPDLHDAFLEYAEYPDVQDWPAPAVTAPALEPASRALIEYAEHMKRVLPSDNGTDELTGLFRRVLRMIRSYDLRNHAELGEIFEQFKPDRECVQKSWPGNKEEALREHERWNQFCVEVAGPFLTAWRAHRYPTVLGLLARAKEAYDRHRQTARALNFQDLLMRAAALLRDRPEVRRYFQRRFRRILVDEFQDTDPVQAEVMLLLTANDPNERDWRKCRPLDGSLFIVGDPKQSIYRFRRADIVTYNRVKEIVRAAGGSCVKLTANFRSSSPLIEWVNATCPRFFPLVADDFSPAYVKFLVGRDDSGAGSGVFKIIIPSMFSNQDEIAAYEADVVARHIRQSGRAPGDFLIIARNKKRLSVYASALQRVGISSEVTGGNALNQVRELSLLHVALCAALEPSNPVALVAALRSELFGFSDQELYAYRHGDGRFDFRQTATGRFGDAFACLRRFADWLANLVPIVAVERIVAELGLMPLAAAEPGGHYQAGSLSKAIELLRAAQHDMPTAADLVSQLHRLVEQAEQHDGAGAMAHPEPSVRVMNLHRVKGLQASVVFLADPSGDSDHAVKLHIDRSEHRTTGYLALYGEANAFGKAPLLAHAPDWERLASREEQFQAAENHRLLYVAATRARDQLIVTLRTKRTEANPWHAFALSLANAPELPVPAPQADVAIEATEVSPATVAEMRKAIAARWETILAPTYAARAAKQLTVASMPQTARADRESSPHLDHGERWGSVIHLLLQTAMRNPEANLETLAASALRSAEFDAILAPEAVETVHRVKQSALWTRARAAEQTLAEVPFVVSLTGDEVVRGVIDLAFEERDGWVLVDYKTDRTSAPQLDRLTETYRPQLTAYRDAWLQFATRPVKELGLYFTRLDRYLALRP